MQITSNEISNTKYMQIYLTEDELKKQERNVSIEKVNNIKITKYNDEIKSKYIE